MMRKLTLLLLLMTIAMPAIAAQRVTLEQLQQVLTSARGEPDANIAKELAGLELTERASFAWLARWEAELPGPAARQALVALVDVSVFLDPPANEIPKMETPDLSTQSWIMSAVVVYVNSTIPELPNFYATQKTTHYEDSPAHYESKGIISARYIPLHDVGDSSTTVLHRDGGEVVDAGPLTQDLNPARRDGSLPTSGVFGPILRTVLSDAIKSKLSWSHWEQGAAGALAVFRFQVPRDNSHYEVKWCCRQGKNADELRQISGYHGEMAVDPEDGAILRLTVIADLESSTHSRSNEISGLEHNLPIYVANMMVEYASVKIGDDSFICPVKNVSLLRARMPVLGRGAFASHMELGPEKIVLNDVAFGNYREFPEETHTLTGNPAEPGGKPPER